MKLRTKAQNQASGPRLGTKAQDQGGPRLINKAKGQGSRQRFKTKAQDNGSIKRLRLRLKTKAQEQYSGLEPDKKWKD